MFIDFHSHFLHNIDDGALDLDMAVDMLKCSAQAGTQYILCTPHCNAGEQDFASLCAKRDNLISEIEIKLKEGKIAYPCIIPGFEVDFQCLKYAKDDDLKRLCIRNTSYMLVEMPYTEWDSRMFEILYSLTLKGIKPVMAHIDRYYRMTGDSVFNIFELDVDFQLNCSAFTTIYGRNFLKKIIKSGRRCVVGTDMHNLTSRPCNIKEAYNSATKKFKQECEQLFYLNAYGMLFENK